MPAPNNEQPFLGALPADTKVQCHVAAFSSKLQRVTVIVPGVGEHTFEGQSAGDENPWGHTTRIGGEFRFKTGPKVRAEFWNEQKFGDNWFNYFFLKWEGDETNYTLPFTLRGVGTLLYFALDPSPDVPPQPSPQSSDEIAVVEEHIRWMWNNTDVCFKPACVFYVVETKYGVQFSNGSVGPIFPFTFRGIKSAQDCVRTAKQEISRGHRAMGVAWLQAGQSHNQGAQELIAKHADAAVTIAASL